MALTPPILHPRLALLLSLFMTSTLLALDPPTPPPAPTVAAADEVPAHSAALFDAKDLPPLEDPVAPTPRPASGPSQNVTVNLINRLVKKGVLSAEDASDLIQQAEADAAMAKAQAEANATASEDAVRVTYIPEVVKTQLREQIRDEVLAKAHTENWAAPSDIPEWSKRIKLFGDIRVRWEGDYYPSGNDNTGSFPNFNAINTGSPFDTSGTQFSPQYNVDKQRERVRLRARIGADVNLTDGFSAGFRLVTGENNTPVSANQSLGLASQGQGGNFSKYSIWLDRAFIKYEVGGLPKKNLAVMVGRFDNPFFCTEAIWDEDVGFDGAAIQTKYELFSGFTPFLTAGAFPVFNTDLNFPSNQPGKYKSTDKYLYGGQVGFDLKLKKDVSFKAAVAYYDFEKVEGQLSDPYTPLTASDAGNTDNTRPSFAQKGNTYMALRNIVPSALNNYGTSNQYQYYGLASPFQELTYTAKLEFNNFEPCQVTLIGEYIKNLGFRQGDINSKAVNNRGPIPTSTATAATETTASSTAASPVGPFEGGDTAWFLSLQLGKSVFEKRGDWNATVGYRYIESDAVVDGLNDSDFGVGGGTNMKGYTIGAALALSSNVKIGARWMSGQQIAGPPLKSDVFLLDLNAKF
jgi:hypothetical protein